MPELPEVETSIRGLRQLINTTIIKIEVHTVKLRYPIPKNIYKIRKGKKITDIKRIGKYILIYLKKNLLLVIHLGMSGRLRILKKNNYKKEKHDHFVLLNDKNYSIIFNDPRKFGFIDFSETNLILKKDYILKLGIDALDSKLNPSYLFSKISKSVVPIKQILLNQKIIAGIGNIYASEILYDAKISPLVRGKDLKIEDLKLLIASIRKILKKAINAGGSTLKDYVSTDGTVGNFQYSFKVYNKSGEKITGHLIKKIVQYGRSTFYCPDIQKK